jgi:ribosomal protein L3 glutamine methyltransferase
MAKKVKAEAAAKARAKAKAASKRRTAAGHATLPVSPKAIPGELLTLLDFVRYAVSSFDAAPLVFAHGTTDPVAEAAFIVCETLHLNPDQFEMFASARVTAEEGKRILDLIDRRVATRQPAAYLLNRIYLRGLPFYVDQRVIVPRSFIAELLDSHFGGEAGSLIDDPAEITGVLDLCTGSGCLAILASRSFPHARIDAVDLSRDALEVAARNVADYRLEERVTLYQGNLFAPLGDTRYDLIISNPPYVDARGMAELPRECRFEPELAFDGGADGLDIVRRIVAEAGRHLTPQGGLLCEVGRGRERLEAAFPQLPLLWLDTEEAVGEVFWISGEALAQIG